MNKIMVPGFLAVFIITALIGYGQMQKTVANNEEEVEELYEGYCELEEEVEEESDINLKQTIILDHVQKTLENLNEKIDREEE